MCVGGGGGGGGVGEFHCIIDTVEHLNKGLVEIAVIESTIPDFTQNLAFGGTFFHSRKIFITVQNNLLYST